jgi:cytochrome c peroxidase
MHKPVSSLAPALALTLALAAAGAAAQTEGPQQPLEPLPEALALDERKVALGRALFRDPRFSRDNSVACISCHSPQSGGADPRPVPLGAGGVKHLFNSPSVWNAALNFRQQWTGGSATLEDLTDRVVKSPLVFNTSWPDIIAKLNAEESLVRQIKAIYPEGASAASLSDSLAVYQRWLASPSRFDKYLRGDATAISEDEKQGYARFKSYGCVACHQGVNVGGNMYQKFGAMDNYFADRTKQGKPVTEADNGRFLVTRKEQDRYIFKVPSLRNVALTAPYFHDGSVATLEEAVDVMFRYQLGRAAPANDKELIIKFLKSLSGQAKD